MCNGVDACILAFLYAAVSCEDQCVRNGATYLYCPDKIWQQYEGYWTIRFVFISRLLCEHQASVRPRFDEPPAYNTFVNIRTCEHPYILMYTPPPWEMSGKFSKNKPKGGPCFWETHFSKNVWNFRDFWIFAILCKFPVLGICRGGG